MKYFASIVQVFWPIFEEGMFKILKKSFRVLFRRMGGRQIAQKEWIGMSFTEP